MPCRALWMLLLGVSSLVGCTRFDALNAVVPPLGYDRTRDVAYGPLPRQQLDVYRPCSVPADGSRPAPVVVFFYGGYWQYGSKDDYRFVAQALACEGIVAVLPDYRIYPAVSFPAFVDDGAAAVRWVKQNAGKFGGDPNRVFLAGHSAGAHIAALLTLDASYLKAVGLDSRSAVRGTIGMSGPYDFVPDPTSRKLFGMTESDQRADPRTQPIHFVDGRAPPMLLIHGATDDVVSADNARKLYEKIRLAGGDARLIVYPNRGHPSVVMAFAWVFRHLAPTLRDLTGFVGEHG